MTFQLEYDDLFLYAPSYVEWERTVGAGHLWEGKAIGTAKEADLVFLDLDKTLQQFANPEQSAKERKTGRTVGKKRLKKVQKETEPKLLDLIGRFQSGEDDAKQFRKKMHATMKVAWREVFLAGVRASGIQGTGSGGLPGKPLVSLTDPNDEKWIKGAMAHEMRFLNGMVDAIVEETYVMPLPRRVRMYMDALESFYDSARVMGLPTLVKIHWIIPKKDGRVCDSCKYLAHHSPYSKKTLPTVPRSGLTLCLTNCRDRLLLRMTDQDDALKLLQSSPTRATHIRKLRQIKRTGSAEGLLPDSVLKESDPGGCAACGHPVEDLEAARWRRGAELGVLAG